MKLKRLKYGWLAGSLCIWLCCAWATQQPGPVKKTSTRPAASKRHNPALPTGNSVRTTAAPVVATTSAAVATTGAMQHDPETGLVLDKNLTLVKGNCTACHSSKLILQSHFDREKWVERIRWMQRTQKLWDLGESEPAILTYLTTYYGPIDRPFDGRRLPLDQAVWYKQGSR